MIDLDAALAIEIERASSDSLCAYLCGATGDATYSRLHRTVRFGQADPRWLAVLRLILARLGVRSWMYREGAQRTFWILEARAPFIDFALDARSLVAREDRRAFVRGFFDAEGGMPGNPTARLYLQFAQRDRDRIVALREILFGEGIECGSVHAPSKNVDPDYWRFYVRAGSHVQFLREVGSWHPRKRPLVEKRMRKGEADASPFRR